MNETNTGKHQFGTGRTIPGREDFPRLIDALGDWARGDLARDGIVELVSVSVNAVPDPERPDDHLSMKIVAEVCDNFRAGIAGIDRDLDQVDAICSSSEPDFTLVLRDELLVSLDQRRTNLAELRAGQIGGKPVAYLADPVVAGLIRPLLEHPVIEENVWCVGWSAVQEDDGTFFVYCDNPLFSESVDEESWIRIQDRIRQVNYIIGG
jgi:hypothetical protein